MLSRILVIVLAVPVLLYVLISGEFTFLTFNIVVIGVAMYEFYRILKNKGNIVYDKIGIALGLSLPVLLYYRNDISFFFKYLRIFNNQHVVFDMGGFIVFCMFTIAIYQIFESRIQNSTIELLNTLFGIVYISLLFSYMILIREGIPSGKILLLYTFISIWACDSFAYIFGIAIGGKIFHRRLSEKISPKKSIEGFIGGIVGVFIVGYYFKYMYLGIMNVFKFFGVVKEITWISEPFISENIFKLLLLSVLIAIFSVIGDLFESKIKREFGVKDSGNILLGHGGFLDRFDSALFVLPVVYYFVKYIIF